MIIQELKDDEFFDQTFESLSLRDETLPHKEFHSCTFNHSQFSNARLLSCKFIHCTFTACDLSNANMRGSTFREAKFVDCKLLGVNWTDAASLWQPLFSRCQLNFANFGGLDLKKSKFEDCVAREAEWTHTNLSGAVMARTDFIGSRFLQTNLTNADFREAVNYVIHPIDNILKKTRFSLPEATSLLYGLDIILED